MSSLLSRFGIIPASLAAALVAFVSSHSGFAQQAPAATSSASPLASARWIAAGPASAQNGETGGLPIFRKSFSLRKGAINRAVLYATAQGSYQLTINGQRIGEEVLTPEWMDYRRRLTYQTYDVTRLLRGGANAIGAFLGEGWFGSPIVNSDPYMYGPPPLRWIGALHVTYADGTTQVIATDSTWRSTPGPVLFSQIYDGERYDARRLPVGWNQPAFNDRAWTRVHVTPALADSIALTAQTSPPIRRVTTLAQARRIPVAGDTVVYDLGQNMVGWVRIRVRGPAGATVQLRHAEAIYADGKHINRDNLREAAATDTYVLSGHGVEEYEPHFTYHGFRYVEIVAPAKVQVEAPIGVVVHTDARETATLTSSHAGINRLWQNIQWSFRGNLMGVPTDCPQRSERLPWLGDATAFWPTAVYLMDVRTVTRKWAEDARDAQQSVRDAQVTQRDTSYVGCFPPFLLPPIGRCGGPGWSDAGVQVPYASYRQYGDTALVRAHWRSMERYMAFIAASNPNFLWAVHASGYGDWLPGALDEETGKRVIATSFWAADAGAMQEMARALGDREAESRYATLHANIRAAFQRAFLGANGVIGEPRPNGTLMTSQTSDLLALYAGVVPDSMRTAVTNHLLASITAHGGHLTTGFLGTPQLLPMLSAQGRDDIAYQLLLTESAPSWLAMVKAGATTIWEKWTNDTVHTGSGSLNHYLYGAVGVWLLRDAAGITQDTGSVGFRQIVIRPHPDPLARLTRLAAQYDSPVGPVASAWTIDSMSHRVTLDVTVPNGASARVDVPVWNGTGYGYVSHTVSGGTHQFRGE